MKRDKININRLLTIVIIIGVSIYFGLELIVFVKQRIGLGKGDFSISFSIGDSIQNYSYNIGEVSVVEDKPLEPNVIPKETTNLRVLLYRGAKVYSKDIKLDQRADQVYSFGVDNIKGGKYTLQVIAYNLYPDLPHEKRGMVLAVGSSDVEIVKDSITKGQVIIDRVKYAFNSTKGWNESDIDLKTDLEELGIKISKSKSLYSSENPLPRNTYDLSVSGPLMSVIRETAVKLPRRTYNFTKHYVQYSFYLADFYYKGEGVTRLQLLFPNFLLGDEEIYVEYENNPPVLDGSGTYL